MQADRSDVVVIGAGIVGVSAAIWLQRMGARVTLIDRVGPASAASWGNAGLLASAAVVPVTVPGLLAKAPRMLLDPSQPLFLRWRYLPRLLPFLLKYLAQGRPDRVERISEALSALLGESPDQHAALAKGTGAEHYVQPCSYIYGYRDRAAYQADAYGWGVRARRGIAFRERDARALAAFDPALAGRFGHAVEMPGHGLITDPGAYVGALAAHFTARGGRIERATARSFDITGGRATGVVTDKGVFEGDDFVLTTGAWSGPLARALGIEVPLDVERGYHMEFHDPSIRLKGPVMVAAGKFVASPMRGRLRCAGVVEFGGLKAGPSRAPFNLLRRKVAEVFPDLAYSHATEWMGHRPSTADSLPVIGRAPLAENVWAGYGHQHVGLTGGPLTGRWLAQMITRQPVNTDLSAFAPDRRVRW